LSVAGIDVMPLGDDVVMMHATWTREPLVGATNVQDATSPAAVA
jgi:hypothetical protein